MPLFDKAIVEFVSIVPYWRSSFVDSPGYFSLFLRKTRHPKDAIKGVDQINKLNEEIDYGTAKINSNQKMT